jgi:hypothetical protein
MPSDVRSGLMCTPKQESLWLRGCVAAYMSDVRRVGVQQAQS